MPASAEPSAPITYVVKQYIADGAILMTLFYIMDPMCSWCYGFHPSINAIREKWPQLDIQYITGGLAPDSDEPMPIEMQNHLRSVWQQIEAVLVFHLIQSSGIHVRHAEAHTPPVVPST